MSGTPLGNVAVTIKNVLYRDINFFRSVATVLSNEICWSNIIWGNISKRSHLNVYLTCRSRSSVGRSRNVDVIIGLLLRLDSSNIEVQDSVTCNKDKWKVILEQQNIIGYYLNCWVKHIVALRVNNSIPTAVYIIQYSYNLSAISSNFYVNFIKIVSPYRKLEDTSQNKRSAQQRVMGVTPPRKSNINWG